jgi:6-phosphofructokinase
MQRIGILTGGGDASGLNAVVRAATLAAERAGVEIVGVRNGFRGLVDLDFLPLDAAMVQRIHRRGGSILGCDNIFRGDAADFADGVRRASLSGLIVVGGNGSLTEAAEMAPLMGDAKIVGVPKTIDNDVAGTEATIGFDTAVGAVENACERLTDTAESHRRVMIVEVMGRNSGFIALHGALSGAADVALLPEIPYRVDRVVDAIVEREGLGLTHTLIVAAEGACDEGGEPILDRRRTETTGIERLGGIGEVLAERLRGLMDDEVRSVNLAHLQRGGTPTPFDRVLGMQFGAAAVQALLDGLGGLMTAFIRGAVELRPLSDAAGELRRVETDSSLMAAARAVGLRFGD